jgi:hypothetical protein
VAPPEPPPPAVDPVEQERLLHSIESGALDSAELLRLAVEGETTRVRQAAATAIHDPALWSELLPRLRGRDKAAYKLVKQRHDALLAEQRAVAQANTEAESLCASIEKHAARPHDALYAPTLAALTMRWQELPEHVDAGIRERARQAFERCREVIAAHDREVERLAAARAAEEARALALEAEREAQQQASAAAAAQAAQAAADQAAAQQATAAQAATVQSDADPAATHEASGEPAAAETSAPAEAQSTAEAQAQAEIVSLIRLSGAALKRGDTRKAARFRQSLELLLPDASTLPPHLQRNLEQLDLRLNELRQWKDYVAAPKRLELIEEMEALIGVDEAPDTLAEHIRALRQEWRTINKGLAVGASAESERFEQAFQKAFQPCQVYFTEQAAIRRANLDARRQVLERVLNFEAGVPPQDSGEQPDYPLIMRVLREAPQEWRSHVPVDRDAGRSLDADFFRALDRLRARVNDWHARNLADKQSLIARAQQLAASTDVARATDEVKRLQSQWKETGPVPHAQSQALWDEFRALCNGVYERRQQEFAQQAATLGQAKAQVEALCEQIEQAGQHGATDRASGEAQLRDWHAAFDAIGELPRGDARALRDRFLRGMSRYEKSIAGLAQRDAEAAESNVRTAAQHVRAYQRAVIGGNPETERTALKEAAVACIDGVPRWPNKAILQALRQALARTDSAEFLKLDDAARERHLRVLCVRTEILSGGTTPPDDAALRREIEMQLLRQGLGQARQMDERDWEKLRLEWLGADAIEASVHDALETRFMQGLRRRRN